MSLNMNFILGRPSEPPQTGIEQPERVRYMHTPQGGQPGDSDVLLAVAKAGVFCETL
jgi:hypothetical protein